MHYRIKRMILSAYGNESKHRDHAHTFESVGDCCLASIEQFFSYIMARTYYIRWDDDDVCFELDQHA
jgi:hypothetical protein